MSDTPHRPNPGLAFANLAPDMHHETPDQLILSAFLYNSDAEGRLLLEKVAPDFEGSAAGKWYLPGITLKFNEHPEEAAHRILTTELEVADRPLRLLRVQSHKAELNRWFLLFLYESDPLTDVELANPCKGIAELAYKDPAKIPPEQGTSTLWDILEADKQPGHTYE